jgi:tRNA(Arg) A34 adenosine deaminase TadA
LTTIDKYFRVARQTALKGDSKEARRRFRLGAVGVRSDGAIVTSNNISNRLPEPNAHAEARLTRKLDWGSTVYVVRILSDGSLATARPCKHCLNTMRLRGVRYVYYSISDKEHGRLTLND